jgi:hypothetical protein
MRHVTHIQNKTGTKTNLMPIMVEVRVTIIACPTHINKSFYNHEYVM